MAGLRFLVAEGNPSDRNAAVLELGGRPNYECFQAMLRDLEPNCAVDIAHPADVDAALPAGVELAAYDGVLISGSGLNIPGGQDDPRVTRQVDFARAVFEAGVPMFGSCWGLQVAAAASGGIVAASPRGSELGIGRKIALTAAGRGHPLYEGKPDVFDAPAIHVDEVTHLPPGAVVLAANAFCAVQAAFIPYAGGTFWGVQYHPEFGLADMAILMRRYVRRLIDQGFFTDEVAVGEHVARLETLAAEPGRKDLAWLLGIDDDILDSRLRWREVGNWIRRLVYPHRAAKG